MFGEHFRDEENLIAAPGERLAHQPFRCSASVELRGVDMGHAEIQPATKRGDRDVSVGILDEPSPLSNPRNEALGGSEQAQLHGRSPRFGSAYAAWRRPRAPANSLVISRLNAGISSGARLVTRLPSPTASASITSAPAFLRSVLTEGHEVIRLPRALSASMIVQGP